MTNLKSFCTNHLTLNPQSGHTCTDSQKLAQAVLILSEALEGLIEDPCFDGHCYPVAKQCLEKAEGLFKNKILEDQNSQLKEENLFLKSNLNHALVNFKVIINDIDSNIEKENEIINMCSRAIKEFNKNLDSIPSTSKLSENDLKIITIAKRIFNGLQESIATVPRNFLYRDLIKVFKELEKLLNKE